MPGNSTYTRFMRAPSPTAVTSQAKLTTGPVGRTLWQNSWPMSMGLISVIAFNIVDTFYIGQLGADQLAAMGFCFPVIFIMGSMAIGLGNGSLSILSRAIGEGRPDRARRLVTNTMVLVSLLSFVLTGFMYIFSDEIFSLLRTPDHLMPYVDQYMDVWYAGLWFLITPVAANYLIRANGEAIASSVLMLGAAAINAVLSPLLVFGLLGFPEMGISGAALATIIARGTIAVSAIYYLGFRHNMMEVSLRAVQVLPRHIQEIMRFAVPAALAQMVTPLATALIVILLAGYGQDAVAGFTVGARIETLSLVPFFAFQVGISPFIGQNVGANLPDRLAQAENWIWKFALFWGVISAVLLISFGGALGSLFTDDPEIIALTDQYLFIVSFGYIFAGVFHLSIGVLNPLGFPNLGAGLSFFRYIVLYAGLAWLFSSGAVLDSLTGPVGVFTAGAIAWIIAGLTGALLIHHRLPTRSPQQTD
ncbi:MATE family efflux transporter [Parvularcula sp. IMCC14364]|uniref:MATE family efflux transporter n=1 Tax=Parvularcula sp. IMCC14364 TaxID=3067902 RepID=UPI002740A3D6|nr:MATE family efflux transporter [Parvularcula sp. IMCC14364]